MSAPLLSFHSVSVFLEAHLAAQWAVGGHPPATRARMPLEETRERRQFCPWWAIPAGGGAGGSRRSDKWVTTPRTNPKTKSWICSICQFPWSRHSQFQASNTEHGLGKRRSIGSGEPSCPQHAVSWRSWTLTVRPQLSPLCMQTGLQPNPAFSSRCSPRCQDPDLSLCQRTSVGGLGGPHITLAVQRGNRSPEWEEFRQGRTAIRHRHELDSPVLNTVLLAPRSFSCAS